MSRHFKALTSRQCGQLSLRSKFGLFGLALIGAGCNADGTPANAMTESAAATSAAKAQLSDSDTRKTGGAQTVSDASDKISLQAAETACKRQDPKAFFDAFIQSRAVQRKYSAASIEYVQLQSDFTVGSREEIKAEKYTAFPITMVDYYRKAAQPLRKGADEHVMIELNQGQNEAFVVEWTRVTYDGKSSGGDDLGTAFTLDGKPYAAGGPGTDGKLLFEPTADCWQLATDTRHFRAGSVK